MEGTPPSAVASTAGRPAERGAWALAVASGLVASRQADSAAYVAMALWLGGMNYGTASRAALLNQSASVWVLLLSALVGEKIPRLRWVGAGLAVGRVAVVIAA